MIHKRKLREHAGNPPPMMAHGDRLTDAGKTWVGRTNEHARALINAHFRGEDITDAVSQYHPEALANLLDGVKDPVMMKGLTEEAKDHPTLAQRPDAKEILMQIVKDELKLDPDAYDEESETESEAETKEDSGKRKEYDALSKRLSKLPRNSLAYTELYKTVSKMPDVYRR